MRLKIFLYILRYFFSLLSNCLPLSLPPPPFPCLPLFHCLLCFTVTAVNPSTGWTPFLFSPFPASPFHCVPFLLHPLFLPSLILPFLFLPLLFLLPPFVDFPWLCFSLSLLFSFCVSLCECFLPFFALLIIMRTPSKIVYLWFFSFWQWLQSKISWGLATIFWALLCRGHKFCFPNVPLKAKNINILITQKLQT